MRELYECEICKTVHNNRLDAESCEENHMDRENFGLRQAAEGLSYTGEECIIYAPEPLIERVFRPILGQNWPDRGLRNLSWMGTLIRPMEMLHELEAAASISDVEGVRAEAIRSFHDNEVAGVLGRINGTVYRSISGTAMAKRNIVRKSGLSQVQVTNALRMLNNKGLVRNVSYGRWARTVDLLVNWPKESKNEQE